MKLEKIINLPVYTESANYLGKIIDVEFDKDGDLLNYIVKSSNFIKNLFKGSLIINKIQVLSITDKKMIVQDNSLKEKQIVSAPVAR
ncbi:PRC-barrel domain-containing protein [Patescibacteria group bacterium]|nr:PRC-barrel domain-containing protein [Patescibacteria group bacterium]